MVWFKVDRIDVSICSIDMQEFDLPVIRQIPGKGPLPQDFAQPGLVGEEQGQVGGEDAVLDVAQDLPVLITVQFGEDVVVFLLNKRPCSFIKVAADRCVQVSLPVAKW